MCFLSSLFLFFSMGTTTCLLFLSSSSSSFSVMAAPSTSSQNDSDDDDRHILSRRATTMIRSDMTLRQYLLHSDGYYLGMAPAFFGFYGYFGALAAWDEEISNSTFHILQPEGNHLKGVAGASAGAMAAILLAAGIPPQIAAKRCFSLTLSDFADFPGIMAIFKGNKFEEIMDDFLKSQHPSGSGSGSLTTLDFEDASIPIAVSGFDLQTMQGKLLRRGSMARAARASACFPLLFQPVGWVDGKEYYLLIDGGITDYHGMAGLAALQDNPDGQSSSSPSRRRAINMVVGDFLGFTTPGPSRMPNDVHVDELLSISIQNLPECGPMHMSNGPLAYEAARLAMRHSMDVPLFHGTEDGHYELHIDASSFIPS